MVLGANSPHYGKELGKEGLRGAKAEEIAIKLRRKIVVRCPTCGSLRTDFNCLREHTGWLAEVWKCKKCGATFLIE